jgi:hypothetical protein
LKEHLKSGEQRMGKIEFAIGEFDKEIQKLDEKNGRMIDGLQKGISSVMK